MAAGKCLPVHNCIRTLAWRLNSLAKTLNSSMVSAKLMSSALAVFVLFSWSGGAPGFVPLSWNGGGPGGGGGISLLPGRRQLGGESGGGSRGGGGNDCMGVTTLPWRLNPPVALLQLRWTGVGAVVGGGGAFDGSVGCFAVSGGGAGFGGGAAFIRSSGIDGNPGGGVSGGGLMINGGAFNSDGMALPNRLGFGAGIFGADVFGARCMTPKSTDSFACPDASRDKSMTIFSRLQALKNKLKASKRFLNIKQFGDSLT